MQKHILSTCLAISLIANSSYVFADQTITGGSSSSSTSEMSDGQAAAVVGGLLLLGGIMSLHSQSVAKAEESATQQAIKAEETATQQATKTLELKPGYTYLWSNGSNDTSPVIEYVESCTPAKQYSVTSKLVNGTAEVEDGNVSMKSENCNKTYDSRKKSMSEQAGDPWSLKTRHAQAEAKKKVDEAHEAAESREQETRKAQAESQRRSAASAKGCSGLYINKKVERRTRNTISLFGRSASNTNLHTYTIVGLDPASQQITLRDTYSGELSNSSCLSVQLME